MDTTDNPFNRNCYVKRLIYICFIVTLQLNCYHQSFVNFPSLNILIYKLDQWFPKYSTITHTGAKRSQLSKCILCTCSKSGFLQCILIMLLVCILILFDKLQKMKTHESGTFFRYSFKTLRCKSYEILRNLSSSSYQILRTPRCSTVSCVNPCFFSDHYYAHS